MPSAPSPEAGGQPRGIGRVPALILLGVLMIVVLAVVLWASGMATRPGPAAIGQPAYQLPNHATSDTAAPR